MNKYNRIADEPTPMLRQLVKYLPVGAVSTHALLKSASSMQSDLAKQSLAEDFNGKTTEIAKAVVNGRDTSEYISQYYTGNYDFSISDIVQVPLNHAYAFGDAFGDHLTAAMDSPYVLAGFVMTSTIATTALIKAEESRRKGKENAFFYKAESSKILKESLEKEDFNEYKEMGKYLTRGSNIISQMAIDIKDSELAKKASKTKDFIKSQIGLHTDAELSALAINSALQDMYISKSGRLRSRTDNPLVLKDIKDFNDPRTNLEYRSRIEKRIARTIKRHEKLYREIVGLELGSGYKPKFSSELSDEKIQELSKEEKDKYEKDMTYRAIMNLRAVTNPIVMEELKARGYTAESLIGVFKEHLEAAFETDKQLTKIFPHETQVINEIIDGAGKKLKLKSHANALAINIKKYHSFEKRVKDKKILTAKESAELDKIKNQLTKISNITNIASRDPVYHELELIARGIVKDIERRDKGANFNCLKSMIGVNTRDHQINYICKSQANVMDELISPRLMKHGYDIRHDDNELDYMSGVMSEKVIKYLNLRADNQARDLSDFYTKEIADDDSVRLKSYYKKKDITEKCLYATGLGSVAISVAMAYDPTLSSLNIFGEATSFSNLITHASSAISNPAYLSTELGAVADIFTSGNGLQMSALAIAGAVTAVGFASTVRSAYINKILDREGFEIQKHKSWDMIKKYVETNIYDDISRKNEVFSNVIRNDVNIIQRTVDRVVKSVMGKADGVIGTPKGFEETLRGKAYKKFVDIRDGIYCPTHQSILEEMDDKHIRSMQIIRQFLVDDANEIGADMRKLVKHLDPNDDTTAYFKNNFDDIDFFLSRDEFLLEQAFKQELSLKNVLKPLIKDVNKLSDDFDCPDYKLNDYMVMQKEIFKEADMMANLHIRTKAFATLMGDSFNNKTKLIATVNERDLILTEMNEISDKNSVEYKKLEKMYDISAREIDIYVNKTDEYRRDLEAFRQACTGFSGYGDEYKTLVKIADEYAKVYYGNADKLAENLENFKEKFGVDFKESEHRSPHNVMDYIIAPVFRENGYDVRWQASEYSYLAKAASKHMKEHIRGLSNAIIEGHDAKQQRLNEILGEPPAPKLKEMDGRGYNTPLAANFKGTLNPEDFARKENTLTLV